MVERLKYFMTSKASYGKITVFIRKNKTDLSL
jgi:hypothetical protein